MCTCTLTLLVYLSLASLKVELLVLAWIAQRTADIALDFRFEPKERSDVESLRYEFMNSKLCFACSILFGSDM